MKTIDHLETLIEKHPFLSGLRHEFCDFLAHCGTLQHFPAGQQIFHEHDEANHFYLILRGGVDLETFVPGRGMASIQILHGGEALGWSWLFPPHEWYLTATASE